MDSTKLTSLEELLETDLEYICSSLDEEFRRMAGKRLLITGGAGFLGYYLVQAPLHWNRTRSGPPIAVTVFDNFARGTPDWIKGLSDDSHLVLREVDLIDPLPQDMGAFEFIVHAAGIASPPFYRKYPLRTIDANVNGLRNLLEYAVARQASSEPVEAILFYSSSEIYGDPPPDQIPTSEDYRGSVSCTGPRACYDESKRFGETLCVTYVKEHGLPVKTARPFNNYGPGLKITDRRVLPDFARDILAGRDIVMLSDGSPTRTFCYSADAITGYYKALVNGRPGQAYNVGIEMPEISIADMARRLTAMSRDLFGYTGEVVFRAPDEADYLVDNPSRRCPSIRKAREEIGYTPSVGLEEGLRRAMIWYYHNQEAEES